MDKGSLWDDISEVESLFSDEENNKNEEIKEDIKDSNIIKNLKSVSYDKDWKKVADEYEKEIRHIWDDIWKISTMLESRCLGTTDALRSIDNLLEESWKVVENIKRFS